MRILTDSKPETIYKFQTNKLSRDINKIIEIKEQLETEMDNILQEVTKNLEKFLPNWKIKPTEINFTINKNADFCFDKNTITADLERLLFSKDPVKNVVKGITHEVFHIWMHETKKELPETIPGFDKTKSWNVFKTIDEGLAVLVSDMSLKDHHENQKRDYSKYKKESFEFFKKSLTEKEPNKKNTKKRDLIIWVISMSQVMKLLNLY